MQNYKLPQSKFLDFYKTLEPLCRNTGKNTSPSFGDEISYISPSASINEISTYRFLCLDIGGTRCKACIKIKSASSEPEWSEILDLDNNELKPDLRGKGLELMSQQLASRIKAALDAKSIKAEFDGVAIVWSNKLQNFILSTQGIGARIYGSQDGQAYRKGEWWNSDIQDGDDISSYFTAGLKSASISFNTLVINNDTVFTAKALKSAIAGVVASTGANTTIIASGDSHFYNSECGGKIVIDQAMLNLSNLPATLPSSGLQIKIEDVCAGKGLPQIFELMLKEQIAAGQKNLQKLDLTSKVLSAPEMSSMLVADSCAALAERGLTNPDDQIQALQIMKDLISNAGAFCAVLILVSVSNQLGSNPQLTVALDSSQARFMPGYIQSLDAHLAFFNSQLGSKVSYQLMQPQGKISVPLQGAANTLEDFALKR